MSSHPDREELMAWHDGEVPAERAQQIAGHAAECAVCRANIADLTRVSAALAAWTVEEPGTRMSSPAHPASPARPGRPALYWLTAAALLIGVLATVRVDCAPSPACERHRFRLAFMPANDAPGLPEQAKAMSPAERAAFERDWNAKPRKAIQSGGKVVVLLFLDWQCPACRAEYRAYEPVFADFERRMPGVVKVQVMDFPLNKRCNSKVPNDLHPAACEAAVAVRLARENGTAAAMIDWLFTNQETLTPDSVRAAAASVGGITDYEARSVDALHLIARDTISGDFIGVRSTPTCFVNGVLARGEAGRLFTAEEIRVAIEIELGRRGH